MAVFAHTIKGENSMLQNGKINFLIGACWGSEGKCNISSYIAEMEKNYIAI